MKAEVPSAQLAFCGIFKAWGLTQTKHYKLDGLKTDIWHVKCVAIVRVNTAVRQMLHVDDGRMGPPWWNACLTCTEP